MGKIMLGNFKERLSVDYAKSGGVVIVVSLRGSLNGGVFRGKVEVNIYFHTYINAKYIF